MALGESYGQTDVMNDPRYLMTLVQRGPKDPMAQIALHRLEMLQQRETQGAQLGATRANLEENIRARQEAHGENVAQREARAQEIGTYREEQLAQRAAEAGDREAARMLAVLPELTTTFGPKEGPAMAKQILSQYLARQGITPGGPTATDPATEAARRARLASGQSVVSGAAGVTGAAPAVDQSTGRPLTLPERVAATTVGGRQTGVVGVTGETPATSFAPSQLAAAPSPAELPPELAPRAPGVTGYINGRPAGDVLAEGALKTGILPTAESGRAALASRLSGGGLPFFTKTTEPGGTAAAETPVTPPAGINTRLGAAGEAISKYTVNPLGNALAAGARGIGSLFSGGGADQLVAGGGGPTPEPTPIGTPQGPFSGSIGNITQGPLPTPAGTPPAMPTPAPPLEEELKRRLAQQQQEY